MPLPTCRSATRWSSERAYSARRFGPGAATTPASASTFGEPARPTPSVVEYSLQHCCPDARRVLCVELSWDSFEGLASTIGEDGVVIRHDQRQRVVIRHDQYAAAMGRAVSTLALAIRTYEPARSSEWVTCT